MKQPTLEPSSTGSGGGRGRDEVRSAEARAVEGYLKAMGVAVGPAAEPLVVRVLARLSGRHLEPGESRAAAAVLEAQALLDQWLAACLGPLGRSRRALTAARASLVNLLRGGELAGYVPGLADPPPALLRAIVTGARIGVPPLAPLAMRAQALARIPDASSIAGPAEATAIAPGVEGRDQP